MTDGRRPVLGRGAILTAALAFTAAGSVHPEDLLAGTTQRADIKVVVADADWTVEASAQPVLLALACTAQACAPGTRITFVADSQPLLQPGAGRFGPGAVTTLVLPQRAAALHREARLSADGPTHPALVSGRAALRGSFTVVHPDLTRTSLVDVLVARGTGSLHISLEGPSLGPEALTRFDTLVNSVEFDCDAG